MLSGAGRGRRRRCLHDYAFAGEVVLHPDASDPSHLAEPGPERQNGRVYSAGFFEDRWRRYPRPSLSRG